MKIVCLGDSQTYGYGCSRRKIWTAAAAEESGYQIVNKGINGDTTGGMLSRFYPDVIAEKPDVVFIMGSVNDLAAGAGLGTVQANIMAMTHQAFFHNIIPVVATLVKTDVPNIPRNWEEFAHYSAMNTKLMCYREWIYDFSRTFHVRILDLYHEFSGHMESTEYKDYYLDGVHFNALGHHLIAGLFVRYMQKIENEISVSLKPVPADR